MCTVHILIFLHFIWNKFHEKEQQIRGVSVLGSAADTAAYTDFLSPLLARHWLWKIRDRLRLGTLASLYWENDKEQSLSLVYRFPFTGLVFILQLRRRIETMKRQLYSFLYCSEGCVVAFGSKCLYLNCDNLKQTCLIFSAQFCYDISQTFIFRAVNKRKKRCVCERSTYTGQA